MRSIFKIKVKAKCLRLFEELYGYFRCVCMPTTLTAELITTESKEFKMVS